MQTSEEWRASMARLWMRCLLLCCLILSLSGCPEEGGGKGTVLEQNQRDYSAAIRWGNFEGAEAMVAPEIRERSPLTWLQIERYKQIRVSAYRDLAATIAPDNSSNFTTCSRTITSSGQLCHEISPKRGKKNAISIAVPKNAAGATSG